MTVYRNYAFPLSILSANGFVNDWILHHFINLYLMRGEGSYIWFDFLEQNDFCSDKLSYSYIDIDNIARHDIIELIKSTLISNKYVILFLDEYYIESTINVNKEHAFEESLIYGFDDEKKVFFSLGFNDRWLFGKMQYSYDEVINAHNSLIKHKAEELPVYVKWYTFTKIELINGVSEEDHLKEIIFEITNYNNSTEQVKKLRSETITERGEKAVYGIKCYEEIVKSLYIMLDSIIQTDYRHIHLLFEHKKLMIDKLSYISDKLKLDEKKYVDEYNLVLKKVQLAKLLYLKAIIADKDAGLYDCLKDKDIILEIIKILEEISFTEHEILERFIIDANNNLQQ